MEEERQTQEGAPEGFKFSCTSKIDALWFCYSPVYQLREYYREGTFNTCTGKWAELMECFKLKTKKLSEAKAIIESKEQEKPQFWELRTKEEATQFWNEQFGEDAQEEDV